MFLCLSIFFHFPLSLPLFSIPLSYVYFLQRLQQQHVLTAGRSTYWDGPRTSSPGQSLANIGLQCSRKHESAKSPTELYLVAVTTTTTTRTTVLTAGRSAYWDGLRTSSPGQSLANPG